MSLVPVVVGYLTNPIHNHQARWWIWIFICTSVLCLLLAPVLYPLVPTEYSVMVAFFGAIAQVFVVLEAMFVSEPVETAKKKTS